MKINFQRMLECGVFEQQHYCDATDFAKLIAIEHALQGKLDYFYDLQPEDDNYEGRNGWQTVEFDDIRMICVGIITNDISFLHLRIDVEDGEELMQDAIKDSTTQDPARKLFNLMFKGEGNFKQVLLMEVPQKEPEPYDPTNDICEE